MSECRGSIASLSLPILTIIDTVSPTHARGTIKFAARLFLKAHDQGGGLDLRDLLSEYLIARGKFFSFFVFYFATPPVQAVRNISALFIISR